VAKLWDKGYELDSLIERFTVGSDYLLDRDLVAADAVASIAHAKMLVSIGILKSDEGEKLSAELRAIATEGAAGSFSINREDEDCHTAIEQRLTETLGELGKKIHTGRSRNDQVLAATRLYEREGILTIRAELHRSVAALLDFAAREEQTPLPGRTHLQPAMPSSVGLWSASIAESLLDDDLLLAAVYRLVNRSQLGAAASYGTPLPLDRELVAELLGFGGVHHNVLAAVSSRGKTETALLDALDQVGLSLARFAEDVILWTMPEFGYFTMPDELSSGSSIMPQKRNPDAMELVRGRAGVLAGLATWTRNAVRGLPSGYSRDMQETKEPVMRGLSMVQQMLAVTARTVSAITVDRARLERSFTPDLLATDEVYRLVEEGMSFRDAYRQVAATLDSVSGDTDPHEVLGRRTSTGTPGNLDLESVRRELREREAEVSREQARVGRAVAGLAGREIALYAPAVAHG
jgi:argininosuccinate lyase